jgi:ABC-type glycerol-3-phosphate transport system permease component
VTGSLTTRLARWIVVTLALIATAIPLLWTIVLATRDTASAVAGDIFAPLDFSAFIAVWQSSDFVASLLMSLSVVALTTALSLAVTIPAAYALVRFRMRARTGLLLWLLIAYLLPDFLVAIPMYALLQNIGLYDTPLGLALAYQVFMTPLAMWLLLRFFADVPAELAEAAQMDGASHWQTLLRIHLPVVRPGIATTAVLIAITVWNEVTIALALTLQNPTVPIAVAAYKGYAAIQWNELAAASLLAMAPVVLFAVFAQRHIVRGLVAGAGK